MQSSNQTTLLFDENQSTNEADLLARDRQLTDLASSIATLADLFRDLSTLVIDQGSLLDSIEYNIQSTEEHLTKADEELKEAELPNA